MERKKPKPSHVQKAPSAPDAPSIPSWSFAIAETLLKAIKEKDPYTFGHCRRVAHMAAQLAKAAGLTEYQQRVIEVGSLFHDLGKMGIPDQVLLKPGRLTLEEAELMRAHPSKSVEIISPLAVIPFFNDMIPGVQHHHERIDGLGYPNRILGEKIPLAAKIIVIADTFDAMTSNRPYRKALTQDVAFKELKTFAGRQFDVHLVKIFLESFASWEPYSDEITDLFLLPLYRKAA